MNLGKDSKPMNADWMTYKECELMMHDHCMLKVSRFIVREAYALSKMTVINEID